MMVMLPIYVNNFPFIWIPRNFRLLAANYDLYSMFTVIKQRGFFRVTTILLHLISIQIIIFEDPWQHEWYRSLCRGAVTTILHVGQMWQFLCIMQIYLILHIVLVHMLLFTLWYVFFVSSNYYFECNTLFTFQYFWNINFDFLYLRNFSFALQTWWQLWLLLWVCVEFETKKMYT